MQLFVASGTRRSSWIWHEGAVLKNGPTVCAAPVNPAEAISPKLHNMFGLRRRRPRATATTEFGAALIALRIKQRSAARWFGTSERNIRRWSSGDRRTPPAVGIVLRLLNAGAVTAAQVEKAAAIPAPAQTNGGTTKGEPPAPPVEPPPTPARADPSLSTAQKVLALGAGCRWPHNDPRHPDFFFCDAAVTEPPYCPYHRRAAFMTRSSPETHPGFRLRGLAPPMKRPLVRCPAHAKPTALAFDRRLRTNKRPGPPVVLSEPGLDR